MKSQLGLFKISSVPQNIETLPVYQGLQLIKIDLKEELERYIKENSGQYIILEILSR